MFSKVEEASPVMWFGQRFGEQGSDVTHTVLARGGWNEPWFTHTRSPQRDEERSVCVPSEVISRLLKLRKPGVE